MPPEKILRLLEDPQGRYRFSPDFRLSFRLARVPAEELLAAAKKVV